MIFRLLLFLTLLFVAIMVSASKWKLPIDGFLLFLGVLIPIVLAFFAHYRYVGRLRTQGQFRSSLRHFRFWRIFLPGEVYRQIRVQILIESGEELEAIQAIKHAEQKGLDPAFSGAFRADLHRRQGRYEEARKALETALEATPPSLLRTGVLTQLARLLIQHISGNSSLKKAGALLDEAQTISNAPPYTYLIDAVRGEWYLARNQQKRAIELLQSNLDALLFSATQTAPPKGWKKWFHGLGQKFAQLTYSQQDEHQYPFFAELCLSLGHAYDRAKQPEEAQRMWQRGLDLCQQPFIALPLRDALKQTQS